MSLDELRGDLKRNMAEARTLSGDTAAHLNGTLWPFLEALVDVVDEIDDAVAEMVDQQEDYLQAETASVFAALVQSSLMLSDELRKRIGGDEVMAKRIDAHDRLCQQAMTTLGEITMIAADEDEDDEGEDDEDEDEDEGPDA